MAIQTLNTIKNWFRTNLKPTQQQFWDTWDSFRHKFEKIPLQDIENLEQTLNEKAEKSQLDLHTNSQLAHAVLFAAKEDKNQKGIAGGYAPLNNFTKLASQYLDIINDLVSGGTDSILSAEQGKILQNQIDDIHTLLQSDNVNLDTLQEIVNAIGEIELSLNTILVNDLTTGGATKALTAEMGKLLQSSKEDKSQKGVSGGYAPLNNFTKLASQYLDIVNDLVSGGSTSLLSAEQGKILQNQINVINSLLASDDINLDTLQEIVNAIKDIQGLSTIIVNDLTAGGTDKALSAQMGKNLNEIKANLSGAAFTGAVSGIDPVQGNEFVTKQFAEGLLIGVVRFIAYYNPNDFSNQYPSSGGSGTGGAIRKGDTWVVSGLGVGITTTIGTKVVQDGDRVSAMANTPEQDETKWSIGEANIGYTPANDANVLHRTGNENFQGQKSFANTDAVITTLNGNHNRTFGNLMTLSTGASNAGGGLLRINSVNGNSPSNAAKLLILDSGYLSVGMPFSIQNSSVDKLTIDKNGNIVSTGVAAFTGNITGNSFIKTGGTANQFLKADGSVDSTTYVVDSDIVHKAGTETISGQKTFQSAALFNGQIQSNSLITFVNAAFSLPSAVVPSLARYNGGFAFLGSKSSGTKFVLQSNNIETTIFEYTMPNISGTLALKSDIPTNPITGTGTTNFLPKFTASGTIANSKIIDQGTGEVQFFSNDNSNFGFLNTMPSSLNIGSFKSGVGFQDVNIIGADGLTNVNFKADGNVGIGTTNPAGKFQVRTSTDNNLGIYNISDGVLISSYNDAVNTNRRLELNASDYSFQVNNSESIRILSTGSVGVGIATPNAKFHSNGGAITISNESTYAAAFSNNSNKSVIIGYDTTNNKGHIGSINPTVAWTDLILNANGGKIGFGEPNPTAMISIRGNNENACIDIFNTVSGLKTRFGTNNINGYFFLENSINQEILTVSQQGRLKTNTIESVESIDISSIDLNNLTRTGFFRGSAFANAPSGNIEWWYITSEIHNGNGFRKQTATSFGGGANTTFAGGTTYIRVFTDNANWSSWRQLAFV